MEETLQFDRFYNVDDEQACLASGNLQDFDRISACEICIMPV